jgi:acetylornithine deacetylase/succinyl-diaminopimelate desuccinylase-like protein
LLYGHYDVQPPDPFDEWLSPPFEPTERNGNLYARGAVDDKGQMYMHVKALESLLADDRQTARQRPRHPRRRRRSRRGGNRRLRRLQTRRAQGRLRPRLGYRAVRPRPAHPLRRPARHDLHRNRSPRRQDRPALRHVRRRSPNPFVALAQIIAKLKDESGRILIPGIYDKIIPPSAKNWPPGRAFPFDEEHYRETEVGSRELVGESGYSVLERTWARPTLDVHGMPGGFIGAGAKTVIPAKATAKVSMRLVPDMTPAETFALYKRLRPDIAPPGVDVEVRLIHSGDPCLIPVDNPTSRQPPPRCKEIWGKETVFIRSGGSIPIVGDFARHFHLPSVMMGFGLPDDNLHAPNEKFLIANFHQGIESIIRFLELVGS